MKSLCICSNLQMHWFKPTNISKEKKMEENYWAKENIDTFKPCIRKSKILQNNYCLYLLINKFINKGLEKCFSS